MHARKRDFGSIDLLWRDRPELREAEECIQEGKRGIIHVSQDETIVTGGST
jgi:hypothetical protein